jgi:UDPglucose 6-dehydrogenase
MINEKLNITVVGLGYVGVSMAVLLAQKNYVTALDINLERVSAINNSKSPIEDPDIPSFLASPALSLTATSDKEVAYKDADFIIIATQTDYDPEADKFNTSSVEGVLSDVIKYNSSATIVIKSTIPIGFTKLMNQRFETNRIIFSPEFLREGRALHDNLYPSRIIVGGDFNSTAKIFSLLLQESAQKEDINTLFMSSCEAEAVKLFANTYLAMRVAYFNELDSFAYINNLEAKNIILGMSLDDRVGNFYNNPSFGYGGYCLPKDTKQLLSNFHNTPQNIIKAIVDANTTRFNFLAQEILAIKPKIVGIFRLVMKQDSDNFRFSAIQEIMKILESHGVEMIIFEPTIKNKDFHGFSLVHDLESFKQKADVIIANRKSDELLDVESKIFTRDVFGNN